MSRQRATSSRKPPQQSCSRHSNDLPALSYRSVSHSSTKPEQKMYDIQIAASIYAIIFGLITLGAWTTSNGFSNQANCLARTANILSLMALCTTPFGVSAIFHNKAAKQLIDPIGREHDRCMPCAPNIFVKILWRRSARPDRFSQGFRRHLPEPDKDFGKSYGKTSLRGRGQYGWGARAVWSVPGVSEASVAMDCGPMAGTEGRIEGECKCRRLRR